MKRIDVVDPGTLCVLCQIKAIGEHVADPAVGFTIDDMRAVSEQLDRARFLIERAIGLRIQRAPVYWEDITDGGAA
ncbi:hypothetical protein [Nitrobacter sp.]|uniref:hypothetical protein n=1 Tax=Nitrobacter sp. TaxID=29420 RepID=UPI00321F95AD